MRFLYSIVRSVSRIDIVHNSIKIACLERFFYFFFPRIKNRIKHKTSSDFTFQIRIYDLKPSVKHFFIRINLESQFLFGYLKYRSAARV